MIEVKDLRTGYSGVEILHGVSFSLQDGENLCIIGPNGCGKTTLLRAIAGVMPFTGTVELDGKAVGSFKRKQLAQKISMLSQSTQVYFNYTIFDTVLMGRYVHGSGLLGGVSPEDHAAAEEALRTVGLLDLANREVDTLSGGQLQRVFLAKILAQNPEIILLDEPTNHLDLSYQIELIEFLREWSKQEGKTVVGVLHDVNLAMLLAEKVLLLESGNLRAYGESAEVYSSQVLAETYRMDVAGYMLSSFERWKKITEGNQKQTDTNLNEPSNP